MTDSKNYSSQEIKILDEYLKDEGCQKEVVY